MSRVRSIIALEINPGLSIVGTPPTLTLGAAYSFAFLPNAGQPPYRWVESGSLPGGVTWTASTATLSASPVSSAGDFPITITLADANRKQVSRTFTLHAVALPLTLSGHVANGTIGAGPSGSYSSGGGYGAKTYAITGGTLPFGLSLNSSTGAVTGTYVTALHFSWIVTVTDSLGTTASINDSNTVGYATLTLAGPFPDPTVGVAYSQYVLIGGGNGINSLTTGTATGVDGVDAGALPAGLSLSIVSTTHYLLAGTPTAASSASITYSVASGDGQRATHSQTFTVATPAWYASLFTGGDVGHVFDVNDMSTLYQDTAATTPVTAVGQTVKAIKDMSPGATGYLTSSAGAVLALDVTTGKNKIDMSSGSQHWSITLNSAFLGHTSITAITAAHLTGSATEVLFVAGDESGHAAFEAANYTPASSFNVFNFGGGGGASTSLQSGTAVWSAICDTVVSSPSDTYTGYKDSSLFVAATISSGSHAVIVTPALKVGDGISIVAGPVHDFFGFVMVNRALTSTEISYAAANAL